MTGFIASWAKAWIARVRVFSPPATTAGAVVAAAAGAAVGVAAGPQADNTPPAAAATAVEPANFRNSRLEMLLDFLLDIFLLPFPFSWKEWMMKERGFIGIPEGGW
jgi:hypothetical protein